MTETRIDRATEVRAGEQLNRPALQSYLYDQLGSSAQITGIRQFPSGFSNLTYLILLEDRELVLRKPPIGADIKSAHDMSREYRVLQRLAPLYEKIPKVIAYCKEEAVLGAPFYLMERLHGVILRRELPSELTKNPQLLQKISQSSVDNLSQLHQLTLTDGLLELGRPAGYAGRQINGWIKRYRACQNEEISGMELAASWMLDRIPEDLNSFIHNDYKYDNLMLNKDTWDILAVLDWEMATVGHPLMDLGTSLGYWAESDDHPALKPFSLTWQPGNLTREQVVTRYFENTELPAQNMLPFYVFGCFKIGVIVQQIYARYLQGVTKDPRFAQLGHVVNACAQNIDHAIKYQRINNFY